MDIRFRQGVIAFPQNSIQLNGNGGVSINIVNNRPILATIASGSANYTISESRSVSNAWGPFTTGQTYYLYWQIHSRTGEVTRGISDTYPDVRATAPTPFPGRLWWDSTSNRMKRWNGTAWEAILIVFCATLDSGGILTLQPVGSQVGIDAAPGDPSFTSGYILRDGLSNALKTSNVSEFLTSESLLLSTDTGSLVKFEGSQLVATANNPLAAFDVVYLVGQTMADKASGVNLDIDAAKAPIGMVIVGAVENEAVQVITAGKTVVNEQWNFPQFDTGKPVYCDENGVITTTKPFGYKHVRVGVITSSNSILLTFDWETDIPTVVTAEQGILTVNATAPLTKSGTLTAPIIGIPRSTETVDGYLHSQDFGRIVSLETNKSNVGHGHDISDVNDLQNSLDGKAPISHTHSIANVTNLQDALDGKAPTSHTHIIADTTGLQGELDGKAPTSHTHAIANVTGLQGALDDKADVSHVHTLSSLTDVDLTTTPPVATNALVFNGSQWVPGVASGGGGSLAILDTHNTDSVVYQVSNDNFEFNSAAVTKIVFGNGIRVRKSFDNDATIQVSTVMRTVTRSLGIQES